MSETGNPNHVFISYSRNDGNEAATILENFLITQGYKVWRDIRDIDSSKDWSAYIESALQSASHVLVCVTEDSLRDNSFVRREISYALNVDEYVHDLPVIPVRFQDVIPHIQIINNEWINYWRNPDAALSRIIQIISGEPYQNIPGEQPDDPFRPYLQYVYRRIVDYLERAIIREIQLNVESASTIQDDMLSLMFNVHDPNTSEDSIVFSSFEEAFEYHNKQVILLGEPGAGKTIVLYAAARDAIVARLADVNQPLPLLGIIAGWDADNQTPLVEWFADGYPDLSASTLKPVVESGKALFLLDGLDELGTVRHDPKTKENYDPKERFIAKFSSKIGRNQFIITSRMDDYATIGTQITIGGEVSLLLMQDAQIAEYLAYQPELLNLAKADGHLWRLMRLPLLLSIFAFTYESMNHNQRAELSRLHHTAALKEEIFLNYVRKRYLHEERKYSQRDEQPPYKLEEILDKLEELAARSVLSNSSENIIRVYGSIRFVDFAVHLNLLFPYEDQYQFRFAHLMLRDVFALRYAQNAILSNDIEIRKNAIKIIGKIGDARMTQAVLSNIDHENEELRGIVIETLGHLADSKAFEPLLVAVQRENLENGQKAADALLNIHDPRTEDAITPLLNHDIAIVQLHAAFILTELKCEQAIEPLVDLLKVEDVLIRANVASFLANYDDEYILDVLVSYMCNDPHQDVRYFIVQAFHHKHIKHPKIVEAIISRLKDKHKTVRMAAVTALGHLGDEKVVPHLFQSLKDTALVYKELGGRVSDAAADSLKKIGTSEALEYLELWSIEELSNFRYSGMLGKYCDLAADRLTTLGTKRSLAAVQHWKDDPVFFLIKGLESSSKLTQRTAAMKLGYQDDMRAEQPLINALGSKDKFVRSYAADSLGLLRSEKAVQPLAECLRDKSSDVRLSAVKALGDIGSDIVVEDLLSLLTDEDICFTVADTLGKIKSPKAVEFLLAHIESSNDAISYAAISALGQIGDSRAVKPLLALLEKYPSLYIIEALGWIGDERAIDKLSSFLTSNSGWLGDEAARALRRINTEEALKAVEIWERQSND